VNDSRPDATDRAPEVPEYTEGGFVLLLSLEKAPPAPRKKPTGVFTSDAQQLEAQSVDVVISRTAII
jgi:hypothetical protein